MSQETAEGWGVLLPALFLGIVVLFVTFATITHPPRPSVCCCCSTARCLEAAP